ncbi:hypothetical protein A0H81_06121 [Grifola frondosa]|uniref:Uncharacterized protein n=1 Tax=Grifola frondosa TaxID=5627 RepID=A0A1C7MA01_GRIFR|nr:hypothetical protein A0H81_06121 [Grifola frondosa]
MFVTSSLPAMSWSVSSSSMITTRPSHSEGRRTQPSTTPFPRTAKHDPAATVHDQTQIASTRRTVRKRKSSYDLRYIYRADGEVLSAQSIVA